MQMDLKIEDLKIIIKFQYANTAELIYLLYQA